MKMTKGLLITSCCITLLSPPFAATVIAAELNRPAKTIYHDYCSVCHGDHGDGDSRARNSMAPPPKDFTTPEAAVELTKARMLVSVREGRPGTAMPGWKVQLSDKEIESVVDYIQRTMMMPVTSPTATMGRRLYAENCSVCHGDKGAGASWTQKNLDPPPRNFTRVEAKDGLTRERMIHVVTYGNPDTAMPGFNTQLSQEKISTVVDYIRTAFIPQSAQIESKQASTANKSKTKTHPSTQSVDLNLPIPEGYIGNSNRGAAIYMASCATCHGAKGDGRGPRAYFILPKPRNFLHPGSKNTFNRPFIFEAVSNGRRGTEMPGWRTVLTKQEIADVTEYVFSTYINTTQILAQSKQSDHTEVSTD